MIDALFIILFRYFSNKLKEQYMYYNNVYGRQLSSPSNVLIMHYHADLLCPRQRCRNFDPNAVKVPYDLKLSYSHTLAASLPK